MPTGSVYFGGTDYGRFLITTPNEAQATPKVIVITQNALADEKYMAYLRALHGNQLVLPKVVEVQELLMDFGRRMEGKLPAGELELVDGKPELRSASVVMAFNAVLVEWIIERNKPKRQFYYEESYHLDSLMPYVLPHGLIMKITPERVPSLPREVMDRDREYWDQYEKKLLATPGFKANDEAQKAFSKLRCGIAGIYVYHRRYPEAEAAFRQALRLRLDSPEAHFRLADMFVRQGRLRDAEELLAHLLSTQPAGDVVKSAQMWLDQIEIRIRQNE
jgi:tetratricopeptide (TPR) repeat protein